MARWSCLTVMLVAGLVLSACAGPPSEDTPQSASTTPAVPSTTAVAKAVATPLDRTPTPRPPLPPPPPRTRPPTGLPEIDAAIAAIEARDVEALLALMRYELQPCAAVAELGGNAVCPPDVAPGTSIEAFTWSQCEGGGRGKDEAQQALSGWLEGVEYVYGAYRWSNPGDPYWQPGGVLVVASAVLPRDMRWGRHLYFSESAARGTHIAIGCIRPVEQHLSELSASGTIEPLGTVVP